MAWAYDFACDRSLEDLRDTFNAAGPWAWQLRDSAWYGDYLSVRSPPGLRVKVHMYPQAGDGGTFVGSGIRPRGFSALLSVGADAPAGREEVDRVFRGLLDLVGAAEVAEIEPYD